MTDAPTRIAELEAELAQARCALQDFIYAVAHDLQAPVRHIVSYARLVEEDAGPQLHAELQGFLVTISDSAQHLGAMLDGLRELARVGSMPLAPAPVRLRDLVTEVWQVLSQRHAPRSLPCDVDVPPVMLQTDAALLRVALHAVLDNAWKFTALVPAAGARVQLTLHTADDAGVRLTVRDNGAGFQAVRPEMAFRMFGRLHGTAQFPGLGAGLAWAAQAMQRLGGSIHLVAAEPAGCVVTLWIPQAPLER